MKTRFAPLTAAFALALLAAAAPALAQLPRKDSGVFIVRQHEQVLGQETFDLRADRHGGRLQARLEYTISGRRVRQNAQLIWLSSARLQSYVWHQGADTITVRFAAGRLRAHYQPVRQPAQLFQFQMPPTTAILDANVYSLWEPLADRYRLAQGGTQTFSVFVPHTGNPGQVRLTRVPMTASASPGARAAKGLIRLRAETGQATVYLTLQRGRLLRLSLPDAGLTVSRQR